MYYGIRGFSHDRKYAVAKVTTADADTAEVLSAIGYELVDEDTYNAVQLLPQRNPTAQRLEKADRVMESLLGVNDAQAAEQARRALQLFAASLDDDRAMEVATVFDVWQPGKVYSVGEFVTYGVNSVGDPQLYKVVQEHTAQTDWTPDASASLFTAIGLDDAGVPVWSQPTGAHDAYNTGDTVSYNGKTYTSLIDGNTYSPEAYPAGWKEEKLND